MRTGLYNYTNAQQMATSLDDDPTKEWTPQELLDIAFAQPANFAPDAEFEYSNTNYVLLGLIIEKVDGKPLATAFQDRLFGPLGMTNTELPPGPISHHSRPLYARIPLRQFVRCAFRRTGLHPRADRGRRGRHPAAHRLHGRQPLLRLRSRRRHLHRQRSRHVDEGTGGWQGARRGVPEVVARQPADGGSRTSPAASGTATASPGRAGDPTP